MFSSISLSCFLFIEVSSADPPGRESPALLHTALLSKLSRRRPVTSTVKREGGGAVFLKDDPVPGSSTALWRQRRKAWRDGSKVIYWLVNKQCLRYNPRLLRNIRFTESCSDLRTDPARGLTRCRLSVLLGEFQWKLRETLSMTGKLSTEATSSSL